MFIALPLSSSSGFVLLRGVCRASSIRCRSQFVCAGASPRVPAIQHVHSNATSSLPIQCSAVAILPTSQNGTWSLPCSPWPSSASVRVEFATPPRTPIPRTEKYHPPRYTNRRGKRTRRREQKEVGRGTLRDMPPQVGDGWGGEGVPRRGSRGGPFPRRFVSLIVGCPLRDMEIPDLRVVRQCTASRPINMDIENVAPAQSRLPTGGFR
eukprot:scaffold776_cov347-Pavlova_lutheri.AAC.137